MADHVDAAVGAVATALHELHGPSTTEARRRELQSMLQRERVRAASEPSLRGAWRSAINATHDELLLWFALTTADASLESSDASERALLKTALQSLLAGPTAAALPPSARGKGVVVLARLAGVTWPAEDGMIMYEVLSLLAQPDTSRELGARLLTAVVEEFGSPSSAQASYAGDFVRFIPGAHVMLSEALRAEAESPPSDEGGRGLVACLETVRAFIAFGRSRASHMGARAFSDTELSSLRNLLVTTCLHLIPRGHAQGARRSGSSHVGVSAISVLSELVELQDSQVRRLAWPGLASPRLASTRKGLLLRRRAPLSSAGPPLSLLLTCRSVRSSPRVWRRSSRRSTA